MCSDLLSYVLSVIHTGISLICERSRFCLRVSPPPPHGSAPPPSLPPVSGTEKDRDRELIQHHVWCIFKQLWTFSSFQPTEDFICYNLISGWNHTAYLSNIKYLQFSLSGHLTENRKNIYFISFPAYFPPFTLFHLVHKRGRGLSSNSHLFLEKENLQVLLGELWLLWHTEGSWRRTLKAPCAQRSESCYHTLSNLFKV